MPPDHTRPARPAVLATPLVRKLAAYRGVDLASVRGTGAGGRIRHEDVLAQAVRPTPAAAAAPPVRPAPAAPAVRAAATGRFPKPTPADVTSAGRDDALVAIARREGPEPTLFATGDLPPFTASGLAPEMLLQVPWRARHAMAAAPTTADAYAIVEDFAGLDHDEAIAWVEFGGYARHRGNQEFEHRMENWLAGTTAAPRSGGR